MTEPTDRTGASSPGAAPPTLPSGAERMGVEEALRRSEARWRGFVETSAAWIWETDATLRHTYTNAFVTKCLGYTPEEFLSADLFSLVHPEDHDRVREALSGAVERRDGWSNLFLRWRHKGGGWRLVESSGTPVFDEAGAFAGLRGLDRDVTERAAAEGRLRESEERYRALAESTSDWVWEVDAEGRYTYSSPKVADLLGYEPAEILGRTPFDFMPPGEVEGARRVFAAAAGARRGISGFLNVNLHRDGRRVALETSAVPVVGPGGEFRGYRGIDRDVTERHLLEEERLKSQKLESIGTLAGGIAHDFNNLLHGVFGYIAMAKISLDRRERAFAMLEEAEKALHLSVDLTSRLLTFSKGGLPIKSRIDLAPVVEAAARFALSGSGAAFRFRSAPGGVRRVDGDGAQLTQVVQNLVLNAVEAMPPGGLVEVSLRDVPAAPGEAGTARGAEGAVEIEVRDHGRGIEPAVLGRIFDPYFTTKKDGSGLGLATAYSIVRNHGGRIEVDSRPGEGTAFRVLLPAAPAEGGAAEGEGGERPRRILLLDDEEVVRAVASEQLRHLGYEVEAASRGEEAVDAFVRAREAGRPFDALLLDLTIRGGLGGREALRRILEIDPAAAAVASSGYSDEGGASDYRALGFRAFLQKPYGIEGLRNTLRAALS